MQKDWTMSSPKSTNKSGKRQAAGTRNNAESAPPAVALPVAAVHDSAAGASSVARYVGWFVLAVATLIGWGFIAWVNRYRLSAPVVFLQLGWLAVTSAVYFLWHTGWVALAAPVTGDDPWWQPEGQREALLREKKSLLKAIKEVEFDQLMAKQSRADADELIAVYRHRAIGVIKALDALDSLHASASPREQLEREVRARVELLNQSAHAAGKNAAKRAKAQVSERDRATVKKQQAEASIAAALAGSQNGAPGAVGAAATEVAAGTPDDAVAGPGSNAHDQATREPSVAAAAAAVPSAIAITQTDAAGAREAVATPAEGSTQAASAADVATAEAAPARADKDITP